jgi:hypothetical protein
VDILTKAFIAGTCLLAALLRPAAGAVSPDNVVMNRGDGSRAPAVHRIPLYSEALVGENREQITAETEPVLPFSPRGTCSECHIYEHTYDTIRKGWHFNATDANIPAGRPGQPWIYVDAAAGTQIPLSYRPWPGTFKPDQIGMSPFKFTELFGRQMPGGGPGEMNTTVNDEILRQMIAGALEIDCLSCHDRDPAHDQAEYASQVARQNFRWAATASAPFAAVSGSAAKMPATFDPAMPDMVTDPDLIPQIPTVTYRANVFDHKDNVFFDVSGPVPSDRCYFCHSDINVDKYGTQRWQSDQDVHLAAGLTCVDCHREGLEHNTIRGYEGERNANPLAAQTTCRGCHLGDQNGKKPEGGRLGAPVPKHLGIPTVHFERLSCTACHSGPWPDSETYRCKTSRAHALGTFNVNKAPNALPHILYPVFAKESQPAADANGTQEAVAKIGPNKLIWPAFWGTLSDGGDVQPIDLATLARVVAPALKGVTASPVNDWPEIKAEQIAGVLKALGGSGLQKPVYVTGGVLYRLGEDGTLTLTRDHPAAVPYMWPVAHNVRPAAQSLGVGKCTVCHSTNSPFFFGSVAVDSPVAAVRDLAVAQYEFQRAPHGRTWAFAASFVFRPWFKVVAIGSAALVAVVLLLYGLKALAAVARVLAEED